MRLIQATVDEGLWMLNVMQQLPGTGRQPSSGAYWVAGSFIRLDSSRPAAYVGASCSYPRFRPLC